MEATLRIHRYFDRVRIVGRTNRAIRGVVTKLALAAGIGGAAMEAGCDPITVKFGDPDCKSAYDTWATDCDDSNIVVDDSGETGDTHTGETDTAGDQDGDGYTVEQGDCDDANASVYPGNTETWYDGVDGNCDNRSDYDQDGDGYESSLYSGTDCDDTDATRSPGVQEVESDGVDNDCDGSVDEALTTDDLDGDGYTEVEGDCNDNESSIYPGASDTWYDGVDSNCDGASDYDQDADSHESTDYGGADCDDGTATVNPDATEVCDGSDVDEDCDGLIDDADDTVSGTTTWYIDADSDGYAGTAIVACDMPAGGSGTSTDCSDIEASINPGAAEACNGYDDDCDGASDESGATGESLWYLDVDGDGYGDATQTTTACTQPTGYVADGTDCQDGESSINPGAAEACNGYDDDCDGSTDEDGPTTWYRDADRDGYGDASDTVSACGEPSGYTSNDDDCDDSNTDSYPGNVEHCDGVDNDCSGAADDGDWDGDGYDVCNTDGSVLDCNDESVSANPGEAESCDGEDNDCNGLVDDDCGGDAGDTGDSGDTGEPVDTGDSGDSGDTGETGDTGEVGVDDDGDGWTDLDGDCDDADAAVNPDATENAYTALDEDCDGIGMATGTRYTVVTGGSFEFTGSNLVSDADVDFGDGSLDGWTVYVDTDCTSRTGVTDTDFAWASAEFADTVGATIDALAFPETGGSCSPYMVCGRTDDLPMTVGSDYGFATLIDNTSASRYGYRVYLGSEWDVDPATAIELGSAGVDADSDVQAVVSHTATYVSDSYLVCSVYSAISFAEAYASEGTYSP